MTKYVVEMAFFNDDMYEEEQDDLYGDITDYDTVEIEAESFDEAEMLAQEQYYPDEILSIRVYVE